MIRLAPLLLALLLLAISMPASALETIYGDSVVLRGLDKISGDVGDIEITAGGQGSYGRLTIEVTQCRAPASNPTGDAYAFLTIRHEGQEAPVFAGWMIASSPALNAFDHHRYDVWLLRCTTS